MRVDIVCNDGSPLGVSLKTLLGNDPVQIGCGGAELAILTLCELWVKHGYDIRLYNNPRPGWESPFEQLPMSAFVPGENRDIAMFFRSPNVRIAGTRGMKIWWSHDQFTVSSFKDFAPKVEKIIVNSPFHAEYFKTTYGIENTIIIDEPVRTWEYEQVIPKVPKRCIFCSVPDRGLKELLEMWPRIIGAVPEASLVITSDYRLWGAGYRGNEKYLQYAMGMPGVTFLGAVPRPRLVEEQLKAELLTFSNHYGELFCYAVAECEIAGALPITTHGSALDTTNMGLFSTMENFADTVIQTLINPDTPLLALATQFNALTRFSPERILKEWDTKVFGL
jgi:hypothetical protein